MFLDDGFGDDSRNEGKSNRGFKNTFRPASSQNDTVTLDDFDADDFSDGVFGDSASSRARALAQQRELQLKKRSDAAQTSGMIRSSIDGKSNISVRLSTEQFTPAVRQFSAPKSFKDSDDFDTEFGPKKATRAQEVKVRKPSRYDDDDDEDDDDDDDRNGKNSRNNKKKNNSDDEDEDERDRRGGKSKQSSRRDGPKSREVDHWEGVSSSRDREREQNSKRQQDSDRERTQEKNKNRSKDHESNAKQYSDNNVSNSASARSVAQITTPLDLSDMRKFLMSPVPKGAGVVQCYIRRNKSGVNKLFPQYTMFLKDQDRFLLASKKRPNNKTSNYLISMSADDLSRDGANYLGKLRSNFVGTEFQVFDDGRNPKDESDVGGSSAIRRELGSVIYAANVLGSRGPRKMQVAIPGVDENDQIMEWRPSAGGQEEILSRIRDKNLRNLVYLINKPPRWNEQVGAYVLNFNGRVTMASVKNFQLVDPDEQNTVVLQFGRVDKDEFTMDLQWPMSPFQAFAITLSSFDSKIACD